jgi:hypothetical protein
VRGVVAQERERQVLAQRRKEEEEKARKVQRGLRVSGFERVCACMSMCECDRV